MADVTDGTDCWRRRTGGEQSVMASVSRRSYQNPNWMWWAYRLSDSSWQCHSVVNSTADRLTVFVSCTTHSKHCTNSELGFSPRFTALSIFTQQRLTWEVTRNRTHCFNTVAVTWLTVTWQQRGETRLETGPETGYGSAARSLCIHRYKQWLVRICMEICKSTP